jgi:hypothetical protein
MASFKAPRTIASETPGVTATTSVSETGSAPRGGAEGRPTIGSFAPSDRGPVHVQLNTEINANAIMIR